MELFNPESISAPTFEHLKEGVKPIMVSIGTMAQHHLKVTDADFSPDREVENNITHVDFYDKKESLDKQNMDNAGEYTYAMSPIDETSKSTLDLFSCTSIVAVGNDKKTGKDVSFLTHQNPAEFLRDKKYDFLDHLVSKLNDLKERSEEGTIDIIVAGGNVRGALEVPPGEEYRGSVALISSAVLKVFGFTPRIIAGPKPIPKPEHALFDTKRRRLYIIREEDPNGHVSTGDFTLNFLD